MAFRGALVTMMLQEGEDVEQMRQRLIARNERSASQYSDSVEKLIHQIAVMAKGPVTWRGRLQAKPPSRIVVPPAYFRAFTCHEGCTACCTVRITLDYLPEEYEEYGLDKVGGFSERLVTVNDVQRSVFTSDQSEEPICRFLSAVRPNGGLGCARFMGPPLSCISAPQLQFIQTQKNLITYVQKRPYGRAWNMPQRPQCEFASVSDLSFLAGDIAILRRFERWSAYFEIDTMHAPVRRALEGILAREAVLPPSHTLKFEVTT